MSKRINKNPKLSSFIILTFVLMISLFTNINSVKADIELIQYIRNLAYTDTGINITGFAYLTGGNRVGGQNNNISIILSSGSKQYTYTNITYKTSDYTGVACYKTTVSDSEYHCKSRYTKSDTTRPTPMYGIYNVEFSTTIKYKDIVENLNITSDSSITLKISVTDGNGTTITKDIAMHEQNVTDGFVEEDDQKKEAPTWINDNTGYKYTVYSDKSTLNKTATNQRYNVLIRESNYVPVRLSDGTNRYLVDGTGTSVYTIDTSDRSKIIVQSDATIKYKYTGTYGTLNVDIDEYYDSGTTKSTNIKNIDLIRIKYSNNTTTDNCAAGSNLCYKPGTGNSGYVPIAHMVLTGKLKIKIDAEQIEKCKVTLGTIKYNHSNDNASDSLNNCTNNSTPSTAKINLTSIEIPLKVIADGESCSAAGTTKKITIKNPDDNPLLTISQEVKMNVTQGTTITNGTAYDLYFNYQNLITLDKTNLYKEILGSNKDTNIDAIDDMIASFKYSGTSEQIPAASGVSGTKILEKIVSKVPTLYKYNSQALIGGSDKLSLSTMDSNNSNNPHSSQSENMTFIHYKKYNGVTWSTWNDSSTDNGTTYEPYEQDGYTLGTASNLFSKSILEDTTYNTTNFTRGVDYKYTFYPKSTDGVVTYVKPTGLVYTEPTGYDTGKKDKYHIPLSLENGDKVIVRIGTDSKIKDTYENRILSKSVAKNAGMFKNLSMVSVSGDIDAVTINYFYQCDNSTVSGKKNIYYRPIDVNTPFPLNTDRTLSVEEQIEKVGSNWYSWYYGTEKSDNNTTNQQRISNSYNKTSSSEYYKVTLNRKSIVNIREYNQNYNDYLTTVTIDSDGSSSFITKFSDIFEISNAKYNEKGSFEEAKN